MLREKILPVLVIFPLVIASCITINFPVSDKDKSEIKVSTSPTSIINDIAEDKVNTNKVTKPLYKIMSNFRLG